MGLWGHFLGCTSQLAFVFPPSGCRYCSVVSGGIDWVALADHPPKPSPTSTLPAPRKKPPKNRPKESPHSRRYKAPAPPNTTPAVIFSKIGRASCRERG